MKKLDDNEREREREREMLGREAKKVMIRLEFKSKSNFIPHLNDGRAAHVSFQIANIS